MSENACLWAVMACWFCWRGQRVSVLACCGHFAASRRAGIDGRLSECTERSDGEMRDERERESEIPKIVCEIVCMQPNSLLII